MPLHRRVGIAHQKIGNVSEFVMFGGRCPPYPVNPIYKNRECTPVLLTHLYGHVISQTISSYETDPCITNLLPGCDCKYRLTVGICYSALWRDRYTLLTVPNYTLSKRDFFFERGEDG